VGRGAFYYPQQAQCLCNIFLPSLLFYTMNNIDEVDKKFRKICEQADASLAFFGVRVVTRIQCIRCGALFKQDELPLLDQHIEMCKITFREY